MPREISAGAVVFRKENNKIYYLLLHYEAGHWGFPKGHIEKGESEEEAMIREIKEETGLDDLKIINGFHGYVKYSFRDIYNVEKGKEKEATWIFKIANYFLAETKTEEIKISFEHIGYKWLPYEEALKQISFKNVKKILEKANAFLISKKSL